MSCQALNKYIHIQISMTHQCKPGVWAIHMQTSAKVLMVSASTLHSYPLKLAGVFKKPCIPRAIIISVYINIWKNTIFILVLMV